MLPNFLVIGAQKAASSWLAVGLQSHPDIYMWRAEIHFFNAHYERGVQWYERHFSHWSGESWIGEKSPLYLSDPRSPGRIRTVLGRDVRLLASLRHPIDRAYSAYWHCLRNREILPQIDFPTALGVLPHLRRNSDYAKHIEQFWEVFSKEQLLIHILEEINQDRAAALGQCFEFLGVDPSLGGTELEKRVNVSGGLRRFSAPAHKFSRRLNRLPLSVRAPLKSAGRMLYKVFPVEREYERLSPELRAELMESLWPDVEHLEELLGRDLSVWRE